MKRSQTFALIFSFTAVAFMHARSGWCIDIDVAEAPVNDLSLTVSAINSAQQSLQLNIYELSSPDVADALLSRIQAGVRVQILEEGQPVGGMSAASKGIVSQLVQAMQNAGNEDFLYEMTSKAGGKRRFRYDHAKYVVIDGSKLLIGSENYSPTGNPQAGSVGNRGWEVLIHDAQLAQTFAQTFVSDSDLSNKDVMDMSSSDVAYAFDLSDSLARKKPKPKPVHHHRPVPMKPVPAPAPLPVAAGDSGIPQAFSQALSAASVNSFTSPNTSLTGLQSLFSNAATSIDIELMTFNEGWGKEGGQSPLLTALLDAAKRGVKIRVLLNDESVFKTHGKTSKPVNPVTIQALQDAANQGLPIQALVANVKAMGVDYIHNKGALADGNVTMISSINWDENSVEHNREAAVLIDSTDIYSHYEALFEHDWEASGGSSATSARNLASLETDRVDPDLSAADAQVDAINCPRALTVSVQIGTVSLEQGVDKSFTALSNQSFTVQMNRDKTNRSCIFTSGERTNQRRVLEIRASHGETLFVLEGYTSTGKLYSLRARTEDSVQSTQTLDGSLYDGSGPAHDPLADAEMEIDTR